MHRSGVWKFEVAPRPWKICTPFLVLVLKFFILRTIVKNLTVITSGLHVMRWSQDAEFSMQLSTTLHVPFLICLVQDAKILLNFWE